MKATSLPGPQGRALLGSLLDIQRRPLEFVTDVTQRYGDAVALRFGTIPCVLLNHPDTIQRVLMDHRTFQRSEVVVNQFRGVVGDSLVTSQGEAWTRQRRMVQPQFRRKELQQLTQSMIRVIEKAKRRWDGAANRGDSVDILAEMQRIALNISADALFGVEVDQHIPTITEALTHISAYQNQLWRWTPVGAKIQKLPLRSNRRLRRAVRTLRDLGQHLIAERRLSGRDERDLLSALMEARDSKTGAGFSDVELLDQVLAIFLAGFEATAASMAWMWIYLSRTPAALRAVQGELDAVLGGQTPSFEDVSRLVITRRAVDEALRLSPPVYLFTRTTTCDETVHGIDLAKGTMVLISPYAMHRHPSWWPNPEGFDLDRFTPEAEAQRPKFAYLPFGHGPHICIGRHFALLESVLVLAMLGQRHEAWVRPGCEVRPIVSVLLRPGPQVFMNVQHRTS